MYVIDDEDAAIYALVAARRREFTTLQNRIYNFYYYSCWTIMIGLILGFMILLSYAFTTT
jgi:hypothetical protein